MRPAADDPAEFVDWTATASTTSSTPCSSAPPTSPTRWTNARGNNILALGVGVTVFWPALLAMRPDGLEAADLARLKGRYEALRTASQTRLPARRRLICRPARGRACRWRWATAWSTRIVRRRACRVALGLRVTALRRGDMEFALDGPAGGVWRQDRAGNVLEAPAAL